MENFNNLLSTLTDNQLSIVSGLNKVKDHVNTTFLTKADPIGTGTLIITNIQAGIDTQATGENSYAYGTNTQARKDNAHAEGEDSVADGNASHAEGYDTHANKDYSHTEGYNTHTMGEAAHAEGYGTHANNDYSHAEGEETTTHGQGAHSEGYNTNADGQYSHAEGYETIASNLDYQSPQHVEGRFNESDNTNTYQHIVGGGEDNTHRKNIQTLDWQGNLYNAGNVSAEHFYTNTGIQVDGNYLSANNPTGTGILNIPNIIAGNITGTIYNYYDSPTVDALIESVNRLKYQKVNSITEVTTSGILYLVKRSGEYTQDIYDEYLYLDGKAEKIGNTKIHLEDYYTKAETSIISSNIINQIPLSTSELINDSGYLTQHQSLDNYYTKLESDGNYLSANNPTGTGKLIIEKIQSGKETTASGDYSHTEGYKTVADGNYSHAEGSYTTASGNYSHAEGLNSVANIKFSHVEGEFTTTNGESSHAEGKETHTEGKASHAEGFQTNAIGYYSHVEGSNTTATGKSSHAEGINTITNGNGSHAEGYKTIANNTDSEKPQHVEGKYNIEDSTNTYQHIVGGNEILVDINNIPVEQFKIDYPSSQWVIKETIEVEEIEYVIKAIKRNNIQTLDYQGNLWNAGNISGNIIYSNGTPCLTAHQSLDDYYKKSEIDKFYSTLDNKIPLSTSQLINDTGFLTQHQSLSGYYTKGECDTKYMSKNSPAITGTLSSTSVETEELSATNIIATNISIDNIENKTILMYNEGKITSVAKPTKPSVLAFDGTNYVWIEYANYTD